MERKEAIKLGLMHYNTGKPCKYGHISKRRIKDRKCMMCDLEDKKANPPTLEYKRSMYYKHRDKILKQKIEYRKNNKAKINALNTLRKKHVKLRSPKWIRAEEKWVIKEIYNLANIRTETTGLKWHVDHIIPLQGARVSGLHVPENLQVIPAIDNIKKKNRYNING